MALGQLSRCRALLAGSEAEEFHKEAIRLLATTSVVTELAQAHLGYGEWLRREGRQVEARGELRSTYDLFVSMGADTFASRARSELLAAGDQVQRHRSDFRTSLTDRRARQLGSLRTAQQTPRLQHRCLSAPTLLIITCVRSTESSESVHDESFRGHCQSGNSFVPK